MLHAVSCDYTFLLHRVEHFILIMGELSRRDRLCCCLDLAPSGSAEELRRRPDRRKTLRDGPDRRDVGVRRQKRRLYGFKPVRCDTRITLPLLT